ncbi:TIGR02301 family protein [Chelatococcus daeguensis]|uniref:TIGR02301 family protein n=1 Tax=Chelatococcus daeguensis TaxID=444444 RepID=A0AAC9JNZ4_9HYPH|nr:TIGR02301 family protein [Chelatococcus daeguensis]APF36959.1 TIGR02301 family protein [Chelatococcus daeguensis]
MKPVALAACAAIAASLATATFSQTLPPAAQPESGVETPPPYDADMQRLARVLGVLTFIDGLCEEADAQQWRERMTDLLDAEGASPQRRERLAGAYNRGYRSYALTYRRCTDAARAARALHVAEGQRLTRTLATRFGQ